MLFTLALAIGVPAFSTVGRAEDEPAKETLERALKAVGGLGRLGILKRPMMWMERGTFYGDGEGVPYIAQYAVKWPDWYRQEIENAFTITASGKKVWVSSAAGVQKLAGAQLEDRLKRVRLAWAQRLFPLTDKAYTLSTIDGVEVNGRPTVGINASHADGGDFRFFFDKESYLIAKIETMVISPQHGPDPVLSEAFYTGRTSYGPAKFKLIYDKKLFVEGETIDYKVRATLNPEHFEEPE
jgi:hypothetical protein